MQKIRKLTSLGRFANIYTVLLNAKQKRQVFVCFLFILISGILEAFSVSLFVPLLLAIVNIDFFFQFELFNRFVSLFGLDSRNQVIIALLILLLVVVAIKNVTVYFMRLYQRTFVMDGCLETSSKLFDIYLYDDYESLMGNNTSDIASNIVNIVRKIFQLLQSLLGLVAEMMVAAFLILAMLAINWKSTLLIAAVFLLVLTLFRAGFTDKARQLGNQSNVCFAKSLKSVHEAIAGIKEVQLMGRQAYFYQMYRENARKNRDLEIQRARYEYAAKHVIEICFFLVLAIVTTFSVLSGAESSLLIAQLSAISVAAIRLIPSINAINASFNAIAFLEPSLEKIDGRFIQNFTSTQHRRPKKNSERKSMQRSIEFCQVSYTYPNEKSPILENVNFSIKKGQMVGIVGASGAGKTTLVDVMLGFLVPSAGAIECDGENIYDNLPAWTANIGYIPQLIFIMDNSVRENVLFGAQDASDERIWQALEKAQLADFVRSLSNGLDTRLGDRGIRLSGGQRQRIGIARALYSDPDILVFDEATSSLDKETEADVMRSVYSLGGGKTMVIIAHNTETLQGCHHVFRVENKHVVPADEVISSR